MSSYRPNQSAFQLPNATANRGYALDMFRGASSATNPMQQFQLDPRVQQRNQMRQQSLADMMMDRASGAGGSVAAEQARAAGDRAAAGAMSLAQANMGNNPGLALRTAMNAGQQAQLQAGEIAAQARLAEQANAQAGLAGLLGQARGQDLGMAQANAQLGLSGLLGQSQLRQQQQQAALNALMGMDATQLGANVSQQQLVQQAAMQQDDIQAQKDMWWRNLAGQAVGGAAQGLGAGAMALLA